MNQENGDKETKTLKLERFGMGKLTTRSLDKGFDVLPTKCLHGAVGIVSSGDPEIRAAGSALHP